MKNVRLLSLFLCLVMCLSLLPAAAFAEEPAVESVFQEEELAPAEDFFLTESEQELTEAEELIPEEIFTETPPAEEPSQESDLIFPSDPVQETFSSGTEEPVLIAESTQEETPIFTEESVQEQSPFEEPLETETAEEITLTAEPQTAKTGAAYAAVEAPVITSLSCKTGGILIKWKACKGASKYRVYRKAPGQTKWVVIKKATDNLNFTDQDVNSGSKYRYAIACLDSDGKVVSAKSDVKSKIFIARPVISTLINNTNGIKVSWGKVDGAAKYRVYRKTPDQTSWKKLNDTTNLYYVDKNVSVGTKYTYAVACLNSSGTVVNVKSVSKSLTRTETCYVSIGVVILCAQKDSSTQKMTVPYMTKLTLMKIYPTKGGGDWLQVKYSGKTYYIWRKTGREMLTKTKSSFSYTTKTEFQKEVVNLALPFKDKETGYKNSCSDGVPDQNGVIWFDCSGFVSYVINTVMRRHVPMFSISTGIDEMYVTKGIYNKGFTGSFSAKTVIAAGNSLDEGLLQAGDLLFFKHRTGEAGQEDRAVDHVALYLGKGEFIHCANPGGVTVMPLKEKYITDFVAAIRVLPAKVTPADKTMYTPKACSLFKSANSNSKVLKKLSAEESVTLLFTNRLNTWAYVQQDELKGYVLLNKLSADAPQELGETRYTAIPGIKLYTERSTSGTGLLLPVGEKVVYNGRFSTGNYFKIYYNGSNYYIYTEKNVDDILLADYDTAVSVKYQASVIASSWIRSSMNSNLTDNKLVQVRIGDTVGVVGINNPGTWAWVEFGDVRGYLLTQKLEAN